MSDRDDFTHLPPRVDPADLVEDVPPYEAVEEIRGARRTSPLSPVAGIDEARLYASIATDGRVQPWRRRIARGVVIYMLVSTALAIAFTLYVQYFLP